jgi:L-asparaginase
MKIHKMLLISTGGTIAGEVADSKKDSSFEIKKADAFSDLIKDTLNHIAREWAIRIEPTPDDMYELDSSNIKPEHWKAIAEKIYEKFDEYDSFVITHGTNTLGYSSAALSFALLNPGKPIILTGSQVPIGMPGSDAKTNLENAIRVAVWPYNPIVGVMTVFGSHIIAGTRVKKDTEFDYDAFKSFSAGSIGRIGRLIDINVANLNTHASYLSREDYRVAKNKKTLRCEADFNTNIVSLTEFPGMDAEILRKLVNYGARGFIIRAFGAGDLSDSFRAVLRALKEQQIPVVVTTQAPNGVATMQVNAPGKYILEHDLAIPAYNMSIESQTAKLAWLLAKKDKGDITFPQLCTLMVTDLRGEVQIVEEQEFTTHENEDGGGP